MCSPPRTTCAASTRSSPRSARRRCPWRRRIGLCTDEDVNGAPFYVMGFVEGTVVRDSHTARTVLDEDGRRRAGESIADVMAEIHAVDVDAVGLGDLGKREGYIARQLKRWYGQFQQSNELTERPVPLVARGARHARRAHPAAARRGDRPRRLPPRQLHARRRRPHRRGPRLGDLHARRSARRRRPADGVLEPRPTTPRDAAHRADDGAGFPDAGRAARAVRRQRRAATCRRSTSTSRSATGSWPASSKASTPRYAARRDGQARRRLRSVLDPGRCAWPSRRRQPSSGSGDRPVAPLYELIERPDARRAGTDPRARRVDRRGLRRRQRSRLAPRPRWRRRRWPVRQRRAARPSRPPADDAPGRRCRHGPDVAGHRAPSGERRAPATTCCCSSAPSPITRGGRSRAPSSTSRSTSGAARRRARRVSRRPCPTPGRRGSRSPPATRACHTDLVRATVDVPAGVQAAIERRAHEVGFAAVGLWAQVPHYLAAMPYPAASVALLEGLGRVAGSRSATTALRTRPTPPANASTHSSPRTTSTSRWSASSKRPSTPNRSRRPPASVPARFRQATSSRPSSNDSCAISNPSTRGQTAPVVALHHSRQTPGRCTTLLSSSKCCCSNCCLLRLCLPAGLG